MSVWSLLREFDDTVLFLDLHFINYIYYFNFSYLSSVQYIKHKPILFPNHIYFVSHGCLYKIAFKRQARHLYLHTWF